MNDLDLDLSPLPPELVLLLEAEKKRPGPGDEAKARLFASISTTIGWPGGGGDAGPDDGGDGAGVTDGPDATTTAGPATVASSGVRHLLGAVIKPATIVAFALGAAMGAGTLALVKRVGPSVVSAPQPQTGQAQQRPVRVSQPRQAVLPPPAPPAPLSVLGADRTAVNPVARPKPEKLAPKAKAETLAAERGLIEMARMALARGRFIDALAALNGHRGKFPQGQLAEEREALTVVALGNLGESERAKAKAASFHRRYPGSLLMPAVEDALRKIQEDR